jgi:hypothetical protein
MNPPSGDDERQRKVSATRLKGEGGTAERPFAPAGKTTASDGAERFSVQNIQFVETVANEVEKLRETAIGKKLESNELKRESKTENSRAHTISGSEW